MLIEQFISFISLFWVNILLGILTPLGAICVIPLYPGFLAFLANASSQNVAKSSSSFNGKLLYLSLLVCFGLLVCLAFIGLIFTTILSVSLTSVIGVISRIAFIFLAIVSLFMIFNVIFSLPNFFRKIFAVTHVNFSIVTSIQSYFKNHPFVQAFSFGFFFGFIILPCNPAPLLLLFSRELASSTSFFGFIAFGIGLCIPLFLLSVSAAFSKGFIGFMTKHYRLISLCTGVIMLGVSLYYLIFIF
jgi:cytochrome c-type biogenesis protein